MSDVTMAVVSCTFVFMAVFIPVTFMGGTSGVFYTQFGITMAVAVGLSCINALTLCPALCAMMMKASDTEKSIKSFSGRIRAAYTVSFKYDAGQIQERTDVLLPSPVDCMGFIGCCHCIAGISDVDNQDQTV